MTEVTTTGTGEVRHRADRATVALRYSTTAGDRKKAVDALTREIRPVEEILNRPGLRVRSRDLSVHDRWSGKRRSGAQADQWYELRIADLDMLEELLGTLVTTEPAHLRGPDWELKDRSAATREAQNLAVMDARDRAEGYAAALGARLGRLVRLEDQPSQHPGPMGQLAYAAGPPTEQLDIGALNLEPELIHVGVTCRAVWELVS